VHSTMPAVREKWAAIYRDSFTADITTTQRSEGLNYIQEKISSKTWSL
jgi:hypothetical protein